MEEIRRNAKPMRLGDMVAGLEADRVEPGSIALTFDDAYRDVLLYAEPILADFEIPATVFVVTGLLGCEPWWEKLDRALFTPPELPNRLEIRRGAVSFQWDREEASAGDRRAFPLSARENLLRSLFRALLLASEEDRDGALEQILAWAGFQGASSSGSIRFLSAEEVSKLATSPLIDIGSHTVSHPMLALLPEEGQVREVGPSRSHLEDLLGREVSLLSYPNGSASTVTEGIVRDAGFRAACGSHNDLVLSGANRYRLPRFWPSDSPEWMSRTLRLWMGVSQ